MSANLKGKVALVTGASRGIGRAIALRLAREGAVVAIHYNQQQQEAEIVVSQIEAEGGIAFALQAQLEALEGIYALYKSLDAVLIARTGVAQFDILINNAGICPRVTLEETTEDVFDRLLAINVKAPFFLIQQALPRLRDGGRIVNLSSAVTRVASPEIAAYCVSKGAIDTLSLTLAAQLGKRGITVNSLAPGVTDTDMNAGWVRSADAQQFVSNMTALGRVGAAEDIADVAAFLAAPDSRWVTGQYLEASGGIHL